MQKQTVRLGVDIGGTFTDVVLERGGALFSTKVLTTYRAPEEAIVEGMARVCAQAQINPGEITQIIHGTTLATNALIERRGAKTALITTEGFRDVIEMRTESRFEQYDLNLTLPPPLLPRNFRYTITERMQADGQVLKSINRAEIEALVGEIKQAGFESIAVGFLHSYVNDAHERLVAEVVSEKMPGAMLSLSCEVSPQMREYERFNTTIANAYIKPLMKTYLGRLKGRLNSEGARCPIFLMHSGGGIISLENAAEFPVRLVESGPAGGAVFAAHIAARHKIDKVLSFDMGGTTAKICLIKDQTPKTARVFEVARSYRFKKGSGMVVGLGEGFTCVSSDLPSLLPLTREVIRPQDGEIVTLWADKVEVRSVKDGKLIEREQETVTEETVETEKKEDEKLKKELAAKRERQVKYQKELDQRLREQILKKKKKKKLSPYRQQTTQD